MSLSSVSGLFTLLNNPLERVQISTLNFLYKYVDQFWPEIAQSSDKLIAFLSKNEEFTRKKIVYGILSKVQYHLGDFKLAFDYAMLSESLFTTQTGSLYYKNIKDFAIKTFIAHHRKLHTQEPSHISPKVADLVHLAITELARLGDFKNVLAFALDSHSTGIFQKCLFLCLENTRDATHHTLVVKFAFEAVERSAPKELRRELVTVLFDFCVRRQLLGPLELSEHLIRNGEVRRVADILTALIIGADVYDFLAAGDGPRAEDGGAVPDDPTKPTGGSLLATSKSPFKSGMESAAFPSSSPNYAYDCETAALQIAFDVAESCDRQLLSRLADELVVPWYEEDNTVNLLGASASFDECISEGAEMDALRVAQMASKARQLTASHEALSPEFLRAYAKEFYLEHLLRTKMVRRILMGEISGYLQLQFLYRNCSIGAGIFGAILEKLGNKNSISSGALIVAHGFARCGTAQDGFVRRNTTWFAECNNWTKFSAVASLGVVHKNNSLNSEKLLATFLPKNGVRSSPYQTGGALFAMGLIHCRYGADKIKLLQDSLKGAAENEIVQHGACLGLGLCSISAGGLEVAAHLKDILFLDNAIASQAAAIAIGLNYMGHYDNPAINELYDYAMNTKHEKISRGCSLAIALMAYGGKKQTSKLISNMVENESEILRYGGCFAVGLANAGTEDSSAIRLLLRVAVKDVSGDVRRAAIMSLVFVLLRCPETVPALVKLFAESFNPHSRYAAAMAIGISSAGTGSETALKILEPLLKDNVDFVRNAAMMAISLVLLQCDSRRHKRTKWHMKSLLKIIKISSSSDFPSFQKSGAILALGLLTMGDKNCTVSMVSDSGLLRASSIVGVMMFMQSWYWFPFYHFLSLAIHPTAFIGITAELKSPRLYRLFCSSVAEFEFPTFDKDQKKKKEKPLEVTLSISEKTRKDRSRRISVKDDTHSYKNKRRLQKPGGAASILTKAATEAGDGENTAKETSAKTEATTVKKDDENRSELSFRMEDETSDATNFTSGNREEKAMRAVDGSEGGAEDLKKAEALEGADIVIEGSGASTGGNFLGEERENDKKAAEGTRSDEELWVQKIKGTVGVNRLLSNPCRVTESQKRSVAEILNQRYQTVRRGFGIVLLKNTQPLVEENLSINKFIHRSLNEGDK